MSEGPLLAERHGRHIMVVTLNRPEAHNAINAALAELIECTVAAVEADPDLRVAILSAAGGKSFCAGADLKEVASGGGSAISRPETGFAGFVKVPRAKPWIAAVEGAALGGGTEISLACDMIVAGDQARFGLPEVKRGIFAGAGGAIRLAQRVPRAVAIEMVAAGEPISATRAYDVGLVNRIAPGGQALSVALELAVVIAENAPLAVRESIRLVRCATDSDEPRLWSENAVSRDRILASRDAREGPRAFVEKRKPVWSGE